MRFYVASAAFIVAAAIPFASSNGDTDCTYCAMTNQVSASINPVEDINAAPAGGATPEAQADAVQDEPVQAAASEAAARPTVCETLIDSALVNDLPPAFLARLIWQESRFNPTSVSNAGAKGIAQFMSQTAKEVGLDDPYDPHQALPASARLLSKLRREFGNLGLAAAAYNAGSGRIRDWLSKRQSLPNETKNYVRIITGYSAADWTEDQSVIALPTALPRGTPCREINAADGAEPVPVTVSLTTEISGLMQRAKAEVIAAATRVRRMAKNHRIRRGKETVVAHHQGRKMLAARAARSSKKSRLASA